MHTTKKAKGPESHIPTNIHTHTLSTLENYRNVSSPEILLQRDGQVKSHDKCHQSQDGASWCHTRDGHVDDCGETSLARREGRTAALQRSRLQRDTPGLSSVNLPPLTRQRLSLAGPGSVLPSWPSVGSGGRVELS